jgi:hypothetical protein
MNYEEFETWFKRNKILSFVLTPLFVIGTIFTFTDQSNRVISLVKSVVGYEEPVLIEVNGDGAMDKRLQLAKLEATKYKLPNSSTVVIKFLSLPMLNDFSRNGITKNPQATHAIVTTVSPIKTVSGGLVFDGADCRLSLEASFFDKSNMTARFEVVSLSCTDNQGVAYSIEPKHSIGYISELSNPGKAFVNINNSDGYLTIHPERNYLAQLYEPIESVDKRGISLFGRF